MIQIGFFTMGVMLSSELPDVSIFTDHEFVDFRLSANGTTLLEERYYALNGRITVCDISSLVEHYMAGNADLNLSEFFIEAYVGEDETDYTDLSFTVIYCDKDLSLYNPSEFLLNNFLTLTPYRRIAPESYVEVQWFAADREPIAFRVYATFLNCSGKRDTYSYVQSGNGKIQHGDGILREFVMLPDVVAKIKSGKKIESVTLLSITLRCGNRSLTIFADPALTGITPFFYTNCFNIVEQLPLKRITTDKIKVDRSLANLGRSSQFYDVSTTKEYEVQTAPLTSDESLQLEQMLTSPSVRVPIDNDMNWLETDFDAMRPILITDFTCELSDTDEKPNTAKFTWRFKENRPRYILANDGNIFDEHFNYVFK